MQHKHRTPKINGVTRRTHTPDRQAHKKINTLNENTRAGTTHEKNTNEQTPSPETQAQCRNENTKNIEEHEREATRDTHPQQSRTHRDALQENTNNIEEHETPTVPTIKNTQTHEKTHHERERRTHENNTTEPRIVLIRVKSNKKEKNKETSEFIKSVRL